MKIKPCPFCGSPVRVDWVDDETAIVTCWNCYASGPRAEDLETAVKLWNNREAKE